MVQFVSVIDSSKINLLKRIRSRTDAEKSANYLISRIPSSDLEFLPDSEDSVNYIDNYTPCTFKQNPLFEVQTL